MDISAAFNQICSKNQKHKGAKWEDSKNLLLSDKKKYRMYVYKGG